MLHQGRSDIPIRIANVTLHVRVNLLTWDDGSLSLLPYIDSTAMHHRPHTVQQVPALCSMHYASIGYSDDTVSCIPHTLQYIALAAIHDYI